MILEFNQQLALLIDLAVYCSALYTLGVLVSLVWRMVNGLLLKLVPAFYRHKYDNIEWVLVTGATDGIGLKLVQEYAMAGKGVIIHGRSKAKLDKVKEWFDEKGFSKYKILEVDLSLKHDNREYGILWKLLFEKLPQIDLIVHNAALCEVDFHKNNSYKAGIDVLSVNTRSPTVITNEYLQYRKATENPSANIIYISSTSARLPTGFMGHYEVSKHLSSAYFCYMTHKPEAIKLTCTTVFLGNVLTRQNNPLSKDVTTDVKTKELSIFDVGYITAREAAHFIMWKSFGDRESYGPLMHYMPNLMAQGPLTRGVLLLIGKYLLSKRIVMRQK